MYLIFNGCFYRDVHNVSTKKHRSRKLKNSNRNPNSKRSDSFVINDIIENNCSYNLFINPIRIAFGLITILLIMLCILSGLFYGADLFVQSSCRLVHYDQSFLISFAAGKKKKKKKTKENVLLYSK
jgi:hypothetical protein